jgi:hypothetical protein
LEKSLRGFLPCCCAATSSKKVVIDDCVRLEKTPAEDIFDPKEEEDWIVDK